MNRYQPMNELPDDLKDFRPGFRLFSDDEAVVFLWALFFGALILQALGVL